MTESPLSRRTLLSVGSVSVMGAGAVLLAACSPAGSSGSSGSDSGSGSTGPKLTKGAEVAKLADIPVGGTKSAKVDGNPVLLAQPTAGTVVCFSAICTHQGCVVNAAAKEFDCACHGSRFAATGDVLNGPAVRPLQKIEVTVSGDSVLVA